MTVPAAAICLLITACTMTEGITGGKVDTGKQTVTETAAASAEDPKDENASEQAMMAHVMCQWMNGMKFDLEDHDYFWRVMSYYAANVFMDYDALDEDNAHATFTADQVVEIAGEVFPTLYIHDVSELPGIPGYVLEEGVEALVTLLDNGAYRFTLGSYGDVTLNLAPISDQGAIRQMQGTLVDGEGGELGTWIITMAADGSITDVEPQ